MLLHPGVYYGMTPRQFFNALRGYRNKQDFLSRERWMIARKMMYAAMAPYAKNLKETEIMQFPWEDEIIKQLDASELKKMKEQQAENEQFWARWDEKKSMA